jgi:mRNA interferase MazF
MAGAMRRGDIVIVSASGDYGKARAAVVIQSDRLKGVDSVLVSPLTSTLVDAPLYRLPVEPSARNGLTASSQIMVDKIIAMPREKCGRVIGRLDSHIMSGLNHLLSVVIGIAD